MIKERSLKKITNNYFSLRSYEVDDAIKHHKTLKINFKEAHMILTPSDLLRLRFQKHSKPIRSKYQGYFYLYDYPWRPVNKNQEDLFTIKS